MKNKEQIKEIVLKLHKELENEPWILDVFQSSDDGGLLIEVIVNGYNYPKEDPLPRKYDNVPLCVIKKLVRIEGKKLI